MAEERYRFAVYQRELKKRERIVRCTKCGAVIPAWATTCPECGIHFAGEARDFDSVARKARSRRRKNLFITIIGLLVIAVMILVIVL
ncbi:MAG TPA: zinc ribbon domain-containing protein [Phycisphaerales bacterium]|nr:zinc ribbon domain-containing protein [Phycisphaerales bacterium]